MKGKLFDQVGDYQQISFIKFTDFHVNTVKFAAISLSFAVSVFIYTEIMITKQKATHSLRISPPLHLRIQFSFTSLHLQSITCVRSLIKVL